MIKQMKGTTAKRDQNNQVAHMEWKLVCSERRKGGNNQSSSAPNVVTMNGICVGVVVNRGCSAIDF
jgi:hypothetical protein